MATKKPKIDPEILKRRNAERASANRERKRIEESHRQSVLEMISREEYNDGLYKPSVFRPGLTGSVWDSKTEAAWRRQSAALSYVLCQRAKAVLTSFGINPAVKITEDSYLDVPVLACTNYRDIEILINTNKIDFKDMRAVADVLLAIKGVVYHEGGHILHTLAFDALFDCALMDNNIEPVSVNRASHYQYDSMENVYPAYVQDADMFTSPYVSTVQTVSEALKDADAYAVVRERLHNHVRQYSVIKDWVRPAWNALEDGRMEDIMVRNTPVMAAYLEAVTLKFLIEPAKHPGSMWPMVAARSYLSDDVYNTVKDLAIDYLTVCGRPLEMIDQCEELVRKFRGATTPTEVVVASWEFANFLHKWTSGENENPRRPNPHGHRSRGSNPDADKSSQEPKGSSASGQHPDGLTPDTKITEKPKFEDGEVNPQNTNKGQAADGQGDTSGSNPQNGNGGENTSNQGNPRLSDETTYGDGDRPNSPSRSAGADGTGGNASNIKHNVDYASLRKKLLETSVKARENLITLAEAEEFMSDVNKELSTPLIRTQATTNMSPVLIDKSNKVANEMLNALAPLAVTADPAWRFRQENGVLDPVSYKTHEPGDSDYWIDYEGEGSTGHNLAVSVLLDTSGSMDAWMDELSVAAYGIRSACDSLEIPCTVSTFDTEAYMLYPHEEHVEPMHIHDGGGTNPRAALKQVESQRADKERQLVVVLTDGAWSDVKSIKPFVSPGQHWLLIALGESYAEAYVEGKGADVTLSIRDVAELPKKVEQALSKFLA